MRKLTRSDLLKLEDYARERTAFRAQVIAHKKNRTVHLGAHIRLIFEDRLTVQYQVQEMLRIERIFEPAAIDEELGSYNPLIPDGANLKATMLIEYDDVDERKRELEQLRGIEDMIALVVGTAPGILAIADEDLDRSNETKTSAVHFLRFELTRSQIDALRGGASLAFAVDHPRYAGRTLVSPDVRTALLADLD
jgi:PAS domain-containing protein